MSKAQKDIQCQNCGYPLHGEENYCPYCRQKNDISPLSIKNYFQNVLGNFLNFDHKIWRTIIHLFKYPAKVPLDYIHGKRVRYSNPFRFLVQVSIIYFLLAGIIEFVFHPDTNFIKVDKSKKDTSIEKEVESKVYQKLDSLDQLMHFTDLLNKPDLTPKQKDSIAQKVLENKSLLSLSPKRHLKFSYGAVQMETGMISSYFSGYLKDKNLSYTYFPKLKDKDKFENNSIINKIKNMFGLVDQLPYKEMNENKIIKKLGIKNSISNKIAVIIPKRINSVINNPESRNAYKRAITSKITLGLFFVLPLFGLFVYLLYYKQGFSYTETLVFIFYLQSVYFMVLSLELFFSLTPLVFSYYLAIFTEIWFIYFLVKNFKAFYRQKTLKNILKVNLLVIPVYLILTAMGMLIISVLSLII